MLYSYLTLKCLGNAPISLRKQADIFFPYSLFVLERRGMPGDGVNPQACHWILRPIHLAVPLRLVVAPTNGTQQPDDVAIFILNRHQPLVLSPLGVPSSLVF